MKTIQQIKQDPEFSELLLILGAAVDALAESEMSTDLKDFWKRYFTLSGDRMVLTEEGWEGAEGFENIEEEDLPEIRDTVNLEGTRLAELAAKLQQS